MDIFENAKIEYRPLTKEVDWYLEPRGFAEKNNLHIEESRRLALEVARAAIGKAGLLPEAVDAVIYVNTTGLSNPSVDAYVIEQLGISRHAARIPIWGLGCGGGAAGLARAADLVRAGFQAVLLISVELCSVTFVKSDDSRSNFVGMALFSDGAAGLVVTPASAQAAPALATIRGSFSTLIDGTEDIMGWDVIDAGLKVRFKRDIPTLVRKMMRENIEAALAANQWALGDVAHFIVHPGGVKVLNAYEEVLDMPPGYLAASREILRRYGNMSSATVLFVLEEVLKSGPRGRGMLSAMGPGFSAEHVLLDFD